MIIFWSDPLTSLSIIAFAVLPSFLPILPGVIVVCWARWRVGRVLASRERLAPLEGGAAGVEPASPGYGLDGAGFAAAILAAADVTRPAIVVASGALATFYDPARGDLRLARDVFEGRSPRALALAAHEAGHVLQDARGGFLLRLRTPLIIAARLGAGAAWLIAIAGLIWVVPALCQQSAILYTTIVLALLVLQPLERDANRRSLALPPVASLAGDKVFGRALAATVWRDIAALLPNSR